MTVYLLIEHITMRDALHKNTLELESKTLDLVEKNSTLSRLTIQKKNLED